MSTCFDALPRRQHGDVLIEALVGVLIAGIVGAGMASLMAKTMAAGYDTQIEARTIAGIHEMMQRPRSEICNKELALDVRTARKAQISCVVEGRLTLHIKKSDKEGEEEINEGIKSEPFQAPERTTMKIYGNSGNDLLFEFSTGKTE